MWYSIKDAAKKLGKSRQSTYMAAYKGTLKKRLVNEPKLEVWLPDENTEPSPTPDTSNLGKNDTV